jgi:hypothetical protein
MSTQSIGRDTTLFKVGWITLLAFSVLFIVWHIVLAVFMDRDPTLIGWVGFPLYSAVILWLPFRQREKWAWYALWILVLGFASPVLFETPYGVSYFGVAVVMALALLLTRPAFFQRES